MKVPLTTVTVVKVVKVVAVVTDVIVDRNKHIFQQKALIGILWAMGLCRVGPSSSSVLGWG